MRSSAGNIRELWVQPKIEYLITLVLILRLQDPTKRILDETIFTELDLIDVDSVELYIDKVSLENHASPGSSDDETLWTK